MPLRQFEYLRELSDHRFERRRLRVKFADSIRHKLNNCRACADGRKDAKLIQAGICRFKTRCQITQIFPVVKLSRYGQRFSACQCCIYVDRFVIDVRNPEFLQ